MAIVILAAVVADSLPRVDAQAQTAGGYETVHDTGPASNRVDMVIVGVEYSQSDYEAEVAGMLSKFWWDGPFERYRNFFNVHRIDEVLPDPSTANSGATWNGINSTLARQTSEAVLNPDGIDLDFGLGILYGSRAGNANPGLWAMARSTDFSALSNIFVVQHELGHSWVRLMDEYWYAGEDTWPGGEPPYVNVTEDPTGAVKWERWLGYLDPDLPYWSSMGPVGAFEGGMRNEFDIYRPTFTSRMRTAGGEPFNAIAREEMIRLIYDEVDPLDAHTPTVLPVPAAGTLSVSPVDPDVIKLQWFVDGQLLPGQTATTLNLAAAGAVPGSTVTVRAYDEVLDFAFTGQSLDWYRLADTSPLEQVVEWQVDPDSVVLGDVNCDGQVSMPDAHRAALLTLGWVDGGGCANAPLAPQTANAAAADLDGDGQVSMADAFLIAQCVLEGPQCPLP